MSVDKIQLLGPFNTGTNLLAQILRKNIKQNIKIDKEGHTLFWKHSIDKSLIENFIESNSDTLFICLYKPIHNWICSMQKESYNIKWNKKLTGKCEFKEQNYINIIEFIISIIICIWN